jgi:hypothetical protein
MISRIVSINDTPGKHISHSTLRPNTRLHYTPRVHRKALISATLFPCIFSAVLALSSNEALAEKTHESEELYYYTEHERVWYGWQTLAVDLPALTVFFVAEYHGKHALAFSSLAVSLVGPTVIHAVHRHPVPAIVSGFAHFLLPLGGLALERPIVKNIIPDVPVNTRTAIAVTIGGLAATALDVFVFAFDEKETVVPIQANSKWVPQVAISGSSAWVGWQF